MSNNVSCEDYKAMKLLQGFSLTLNCLGELPIFFFSGKLGIKSNLRY